MVSIELGLKMDQTMKKSTQGFILVKNLFMLESIVNRSQDLFSSLGPLGMERIGKLKNRFLKLFLEDWNHASFIIIRDMTNIVSQLAIAGSSSGTTSGTGEGQFLIYLIKKGNKLKNCLRISMNHLNKH